MVDDLYDYYKSCKEEKGPHAPYFLGTVVIHPHVSDKNSKGKPQRVVIDGQQRLITLSLLVKSLLGKCRTYTVLEKMIYRVSRRNDKVMTGEIKIDHKVLGDEEGDNLEKILISGDSPEASIYKENYEAIEGRINEILDAPEFDTEKISSFIDSIIEETLILPIICENVDSALTVFETINNRGIPLKDADIFKASLYQSAEDVGDKDNFILRWNEVDRLTEENECFSLQDVFTDYMHIIRGANKDTGSVVGIRKFFTAGSNERKSRLKNDRWDSIMTSVEKIVWSWYYLTDEAYGADSEIINWARVLIESPNQLWEYPVMTFLHKNIEGDNLENWKLGKANISKFKKLLRTTARFCYLKWLKDRNVNPLKTPIYKCVRSITRGSDYLSELENNLDDIKEKDLDIIMEQDINNRSRGICYLLAILNGEQTNSIPRIANDIEHILPKKWHRYKYDGWDDNYSKEAMEKVGNRVVLEKEHNISISNNFFEDKKKVYKKSKIAEVRDIARFKKWTPAEYRRRTTRIHRTLRQFFFSKK